MKATLAIEFSTRLSITDPAALKLHAVEQLRKTSNDPESSSSRTAAIIMADRSGAAAVQSLVDHRALDVVPGINVTDHSIVCRPLDDGFVEIAAIYHVEVISLPSLVRSAVDEAGQSFDEIAAAVRSLYLDSDDTETAIKAMVRVTHDIDPFATVAGADSSMTPVRHAWPL